MTPCCIYGLGVTTGTSPTTYAPTSTVNRAQMAAFLERLYNVLSDTDCPIVATPFTDVAMSSFAYKPVGCIYGLGVTTGTSPTTYAPTNTVNREQMAAFLARLLSALEG